MSATNSKKISILVVDDNEGDWVLLKRAFEESKQNVSLKYCKNAQEVLSFLNDKGNLDRTAGDHKPDLILLDVRMPGVDGFSLCKYLATKPNLKDIPIIFLSGFGTSVDVQQGIRSGASYYFVKPVDFSKLFLKISELLGCSFS